jgi:sugar phosphate isomerase/epimerase
MKILFSTGSLYYLPVREVFLLAAEAGFDGCDLVIDRRFNNPDYIESVKTCIEILPVLSVHAPYAKIPAWKDHKEALRQSIRIGEALGAEVVNFHPPSWFSFEIGFLRWFRRVADFQKEFGSQSLSIALENMSLMGNRLRLAPYVLNDYRDLIDFGVKKNLCFTFDTTHVATFDEDLIEALIQYLKTGRLKNVHLSDSRAFKSHLFLGKGDLPLAKLLNTMRRLGYDGMVTLEISPDELPKAREWLVKMMRYQRDFIELHLKKDRNA